MVSAKFTRRMNKEKEGNEIFLSGASGSPGLVIGKASLYRRNRPEVSSTPRDDNRIQFHIDKFHEAQKQADQELKNLLEESGESESAAAIIRAQREMLNDPELVQRIEQVIADNKQQADSAIHKVFEGYLQVIRQNSEEAYLERSVDIVDVRDRLIQIIHNKDDEVAKGSILVAEELSPREVIEFSNYGIQGIIMDRGGTTSHAAIIARSMNIPTVVGLKSATEQVDSGQTVILDGQKGDVIVAPKASTLEKYEELMEQQVKTNTDLETICKQPNETSDGKPFSLQANIEFTEELSTLEKYRADGIGLLRTESIYMSHDSFRNVEQQESFYGSILEITDPKPVTIRLFDGGGDKFLGGAAEGGNSFLGWRGIRMLLDEKELLKNQLKAILTTAAEHPGRTRVMVPMLSTLDELVEVKDIMLSVQGELIEQGVAVDEELELGIMVEIPCVAMQADFFARHVDFMSIGTNDLTQYVLAADRGNEHISMLYDQRHPVIWRLIKQVEEAARREKIPLSVCGELASDPISACCLMGLGINKLSMNPVVLPTVKKMLCEHSFSDMEELSEDVLAANTLKDINEIFLNWKDTK